MGRFEGIAQLASERIRCILKSNSNMERCLRTKTIDDRGELAAEFWSTAKQYRVDLAATLFLFVVTAILAGRVWRFAFDDELSTFLTERLGLDFWHTAGFYLRGEGLNPPLTFLMFFGLNQLGLSEPAMRIVSLSMTMVTLSLIEVLAFTFLERQGQVNGEIRLLGILLFALTPMALNLGDASRWYPTFALGFALFLTLYFAGNSLGARLCAGVMLGLLASINYMAILVALPFAFYRYGLERRFSFRFDVPFWGLVGLFGLPGVITFYGVVTTIFSTVTRVLHANPLEALAITGLGFFGGNALGIGFVWIVLPTLIVTLVALFGVIDWKRPNNPVHLVCLLLASVAVMAIAGFEETQSYLYAAPLAVLIQLLFLNRLNQNLIRVVAVLLLSTSIGAVANIYHPVRPYKRETAIPFRNVADFVHDNQQGSTLVVLTDFVLADALGSYPAGRECVSTFYDNRTCFSPGRRYDTIILVYGNSARLRTNREIDAGAARALPAVLRAEAFDSEPDDPQMIQLGSWLGTKALVARAKFGEDRDAALKRRLSGVALDDYLLSAEIYR